MPRFRPRLATTNAPERNIANISHRRDKQMDLSQAFREYGVVIGPSLQPESTDDLPNSTHLVFKKEIDRWIEYYWHPAFDPAVQDFEANVLPQIEPLKGKTCLGRSLVKYQQRDRSPFYKPADVGQKCFVVLVFNEGEGFPLISKGSQDVEIPTEPCTPIGPLPKGSVVIFRASVYRYEPQVTKEGCTLGILSYE